MPQTLPKIADSEWRIMKLLWKKAPQTAEEMIGCLKHSTRWNPRTVKTLLNRLVKKSAISYTKNGRSYLYSPLVDEKECIRAESRSFIDRVYGGGLKPMLAAFIEEESLSKKEIEELKRILDKKGK
jgi:BlaI family transcriptional regulator, penicillinase repressor